MKRLPMQASCPGGDSIGWEMWIPYGIGIALVGLAFPALAAMLLLLRSRPEPRTDILVCMSASQAAAVAYVLWGTVGGGIGDRLSELFVVWAAVFAAHVSSVCWPLWCDMRRRRRGQQQQQHPGSPPEKAARRGACRESEHRRSIYAALCADFRQTMEDRARREGFLAFAARYYHTSLPAFLGDYHLLKCQAVAALQEGRGGQSECPDGQGRSSGGGNEALPALPEAGALSSQVAGGPRELFDRHPLAARIPISSGILESAVRFLPPATISKATQLPGAVKSAFSSLVHTYLARGACMSIGIPADVIEEVQAAVEQSDVTLSVLDRAKDEAMFLLCTDVYSGYCRWLETQRHSMRK